MAASRIAAGQPKPIVFWLPFYFMLGLQLVRVALPAGGGDALEPFEAMGFVFLAVGMTAVLKRLEALEARVAAAGQPRQG